jgi:hypothetical protein
VFGRREQIQPGQRQIRVGGNDADHAQDPLQRRIHRVLVE